MQLNTHKIINELKRLGKNRTWLANQLNTTRQNVSYILKSKKITHAEKIARVLDFDPKDLII